MATSNVGPFDVSGTLDCLRPWEWMQKPEDDTYPNAVITGLPWEAGGQGLTWSPSVPTSLPVSMPVGRGLTQLSPQPELMSHDQVPATVYMPSCPHASMRCELV